MRNREEKEKKRKWLIIILVIGIVICLMVTIWTLFFRDSGSTPIAPDYPPQGTEQNQLPIDGDDGDKLDSPVGGGAINVTYNVNATVDLSEGQVSLSYANLQASNQDVAILIQIDDLVIAKSDLINPGYGVNVLELEPTAKEKLPIGGYDAELIVRAYNPETGEKAMIDTKGELTVTVQE